MPNLREILDPSRSALLVIDVQNDFCSPEGNTAKSGRSIAHGLEMVPRLIEFIDVARKHKVPVIFVTAMGTPATESVPWLSRTSDVPKPGNCREGSWGAELYGVNRLPDELMIVKHRNNSFHNTRLESVLRTLKVETVLVTGVATNVSVETTARDAVQRDYYVVLVEDCCAAYERAFHEGTVENIRSFFGRVASRAEVGSIWSDYD
jgi:ureidoacrylate peracid hydrolase